MNNIAVLASGNGSNFQALVEAQAKTDAVIKLLVVNNPQAYVIERAKKLNVDYVILDNKNYESREQYDDALVTVLEVNDIDYVLLAGFMRILSPHIVERFKDRIINIHPSLLPKYPGVAAIKQAFEAGEKESGVTVHYVDQGLDSGKIILQEKLEIKEEDNLESLTDKVHKLEHKLYPQAVKLVLDKE